MFARSLERDLERWAGSSRPKPLILRGARQVGKSTLVREFARKNGFQLLELNLERYVKLIPLFATFDIKKILLEIDSIFECKVSALSKPLLFLDEIQAVPSAIAALRYFYEDCPEIRVIAAGSLLEFALSKFQYSVPVGRIEYRYIGPLSFEEFLAAKNQNFLLEHLREAEQDLSVLSDIAHDKLLVLLREFLFLGGMPEVVAKLVETDDPFTAGVVHQSLLDTFENDLAKYSSGTALERMRNVFQKLPLHVGKKIKYVNFSKEDQAKEIKQSLNQLAMAQLWYPVFHSDGTGLPLGATASSEVRKVVYLDVGLMNRALDLKWSHIAKLSERTLCNEGIIAEQFVGQELLGRGDAYEKPSLFYWLREGKTGNAEVDYLIAAGRSVLPIEVKSGKSGSLKSLEYFAKTHDSPLAVRFDLNKPNFQRKPFPLLSLPLYMAQRCPSIIENFLQDQLPALKEENP